jgi:hypothetical protein
MASRDFSFLSLRPPMVAYQANGLPVQGNTVLITSSNGAASFSNSINVSSACVSTLDSNYISSNIISTNILDATIVNAASISTITHFTSTTSTVALYTGYLQSNQALISGPTFSSWDNATLTVNDTISITGATSAQSQLFLHNGRSRLGTSDPYGGLFLQASTPQSIFFTSLDAGNIYGSVGPQSASFNGSVNVASSLNTSTISTLTLSIRNRMNLLSTATGQPPLEVSWDTDSLYLNGFPVATDATVSTVSSVFWQDGSTSSGIIVTRHFGVGDQKYLVGIGYNTTESINATLDVKYIGSASGNVLNVAAASNRLTMDNNGVVFITNYLSTNTINMNDGSININNGSILNLSTIDNQSAPLNINDATVTITNGNLVVPTDTNYISTNIINMTNGNIFGISTITPTNPLKINGTTNINGNLNLTGDFNSLSNNIYVDLTNTDFVVKKSTINGDDATTIENSSDNPLIIGTISGNDTTTRNFMYFQNAGSGQPKYVGINTTTPQFTLDINGNTRTSNTTITNTLNVNTISSGNVVNRLTPGDGILLNGQTSGNFTGNITVSAIGREYIDIITYNPNGNITDNYGKYSIIDQGGPAVTSITLDSSLNPLNGTFINFVNQRNTNIILNTSGDSTTVFPNTLITPIFYSSIYQPTGRWIVPLYYYDYIAPITQTYTVGQTSITKPSGQIRDPIFVTFTLYGGGGSGAGGGGGCYGVNDNASGGGGGSGGSGAKTTTIQIAYIGQTINCTVGAGGALASGGSGSGGGTADANPGNAGNNGGTTTVTIVGGSSFTAGGGTGGGAGGGAQYGDNPTAGGGGGAGTGGTGTINGSNGNSGSSGSSSGFSVDTGGAGGAGVPGIDGYGSGGSGGKGGDTAHSFYGSGSDGQAGGNGAVIVVWIYN